MATLRIRIEFRYRTERWPTLVAGALAALRAHDLWLDFRYFGVLGGRLSPIPTDDALIAECMTWDRERVLHATPNRGLGVFEGDHCAIDPVASPSITLHVSAASLEARRATIVEGLVEFIKEVHDCGARIVRATVELEEGEPYPRLRPPRESWDSGFLLAAFDPTVRVQPGSHAERDQKEAKAILAIPTLPGVERASHAGLAILRFVRDLVDREAIAAGRALADRMAFIALNQPRSIAWSEQGDEIHGIDSPKRPHEPLTWRDESGRGFKAVLPDTADWAELARWRRDGLPDGTSLRELWIIVPFREEAILLTEKVKDAGLDGVLYAVGEGQHLWNPNPRGPWQPPLTAAELALRPSLPAPHSDPTMHWRPLSTEGCPHLRDEHHAFWTGDEVVVIGTFPGRFGLGAYDPRNDRWRTLSEAGAPLDRYNAAATRAGQFIFVWGGFQRVGRKQAWLKDGARYSLREGAWLPISADGAPAARGFATATSTGEEVIVWGGYAGKRYLDSGGIYDSARDSWRKMSAKNAPQGRASHAALWTGEDLLVLFGDAGSLDAELDAGLYNLRSDKWSPLSCPKLAGYSTAVWTGEIVVVCNEHEGIITLDPRSGEASPRVPLARVGDVARSPRHTAVWTGSEMVVWGGALEGAVYTPKDASLRRISGVGAPAQRSGHVAVWTGSEMVVWGGEDTETRGLRDGARLELALEPFGR